VFVTLPVRFAAVAEVKAAVPVVTVGGGVEDGVCALVIEPKARKPTIRNNDATLNLIF
jgi:hypothetical protein